MLDLLLHETTTTSYEIMVARAQAEAAQGVTANASDRASNDAAAQDTIYERDARSTPWQTPWLLLWTL